MASLAESIRLVTKLGILLAITSYSLQATLQLTPKPNDDSAQATIQLTPKPNDDSPFGNECDKNDDCSCMSGGVPLCYGGYCHCVYSAAGVCDVNPCAQFCPSGIGVCLHEKCLCYTLVEDREATDKINLKPGLLNHKDDDAVPTLLK